MTDGCQSIKEVADYFRVHTNTIRNWITTGTLEALRIRGTIRIPHEAIVKLEAKSKIKTRTVRI